MNQEIWDETYTPLERDAYAEGKQVAEAAATWIVDGNTDLDTARQMLGQLQNGDPASEAWMPSPNLSGEWADDPTPLSLARDLTGEADPDAETIDALADAWEAGVSEHLEAACEAELIKFTS